VLLLVSVQLMPIIIVMVEDDAYLLVKFRMTLV